MRFDQLPEDDCPLTEVELFKLHGDIHERWPGAKLRFFKDDLKTHRLTGRIYAQMRFNECDIVLCDVHWFVNAYGPIVPTVAMAEHLLDALGTRIRGA